MIVVHCMAMEVKPSMLVLDHSIIVTSPGKERLEMPNNFACNDNL